MALYARRTVTKSKTTARSKATLATPAQLAAEKARATALLKTYGGRRELLTLAEARKVHPGLAITAEDMANTAYFHLRFRPCSICGRFPAVATKHLKLHADGTLDAKGHRTDPKARAAIAERVAKARKTIAATKASGYDTNLAAEYYVLSCLHRIGLTANLTLGNKKGVDIVVVRDAGDAVTVEVKGVAKKYDWPATNLVTENPDRHFVALVSFEGRIADADMPSPRTWLLPFPEAERFKRTYPGGRINVSRSALRKAGSPFENAWHLIEGRHGPRD